jgi:hypothetical protein
MRTTMMGVFFAADEFLYRQCRTEVWTSGLDFMLLYSCFEGIVSVV